MRPSLRTKDKALWDGKFSFLEQQKEQAKSDLQGSHPQVRDDSGAVAEARECGEGQDRAFAEHVAWVDREQVPVVDEGADRAELEGQGRVE